MKDFIELLSMKRHLSKTNKISAYINIKIYLGLTENELLLMPGTL